MRVKTESSIKSIRPSNIRAFDGKWRYKAASETPTSAANLAVVMRCPGPLSSINAKHSKICCFLLGF